MRWISNIHICCCKLWFSLPFFVHSLNFLCLLVLYGLMYDFIKCYLFVSNWSEWDAKHRKKFIGKESKRDTRNGNNQQLLCDSVTSKLKFFKALKCFLVDTTYTFMELKESEIYGRITMDFRLKRSGKIFGDFKWLYKDSKKFSKKMLFN
jgi:hypothetical protein